MRFGFVTCVQLGLSCMEAIDEVGGRLAVAATLQDHLAREKSGRVYLDEFCGSRGIPLVKLRSINDPQALTELARLELDWLFIIGWSQIAGPPVLALPTHGVIGMHPTLLPEGRGRAAIPWAILKDLDRTGVTMFKLDSGVDTGPIIAQIEIPLAPDTDAAELYERVEKAHVALMREAFPLLAAGRLPLREQDHSRATVWPGRKPEDGEIDLAGSVADAERLVRAVTRPYPGAFFVRDGEKVIVWRARIAGGGAHEVLRFPDGALELLETERIPLSR